MTRVLALLAVLALGLPTAAPAQEAKLLRLGTASLAGVYFPVGVALCRLVNAERRDHGIRCAAIRTGGSVDNIAALRAGTLDMAIVQADVAAAATAGTQPFADQPPLEALRSVLALYPEALTVVARAEAGVASLEDLAGKRIAVGEPGSGGRALWDALAAQQGWTADDFAESLELAPRDQAAALCDGRIDAFVFAVGHPALSVQEATTGCDARLVPLEAPAVAALIAETPARVPVEIPGGLYRGAPEATPTFGVRAVVVARADVADETVRTFVAAALDDLDALRGLNPVLVGLVADESVPAAGVAPLHPGAADYFRAQGWIAP